MALNVLEMTSEKRVISKWGRKSNGKSMQQVVYIETKGGKTTSQTRHEPTRNAVDNK